MQVTLKRMTDEDRHVVTNMFTAYFYDLSQYDDNLIINAHGLPTWAPSGGPGPRTHEECVVQNWWIRDQAELYIIRANGNPAGFVIILTSPAHLPPGIEYELMDFYIAPKYRRQGVGRAAAQAAFDLYHGKWVVYQLARNVPARRFWQGVVGDYTGGKFENLQGGIEQRFRN